MELGEKQYLNLMENILNNGIISKDRTGIGTKSMFGNQMKFSLENDQFPLLTTKKVYLKSIFIELIWIIRGETNIKYLVDRGVNIWNEWPFTNYLKKQGLVNKFIMYSDEWKLEMKKFIQKIKDDKNFADQWGDLGPVYGKQWRNFNGEGIDQLKKVIYGIKNNPGSRRLIVCARNPIEIDNMLLPPCHSFFQFNVNQKENKLNLSLLQRSGDVPLGIPFNIASYSLLLILVSKITGLKPGVFTHNINDAHIYLNQIEGCKEQITRKPYNFPTIKIKKEIKTLLDIENLEFNDIEIKDYNHYPKINFPIAV